MCFNKKLTGNFVGIKRATKNIVVYKVIKKGRGKSLFSVYQDFKYEVGKKYSLSLYKRNSFLEDKSPEIAIGFHAYGRLRNTEMAIIGYKHERGAKHPTPQNHYRWGFLYYGSIVSIECIIPRGSYYYFNGVDYVSTDIVIKKIIRTLERS